MRKLKFRAWNKKYKEMFSWKRLLELNENNTKEGPNKTIHHEHISLFQMILTNNDIGDAYELMQSTGLLDKNGKEIYEGDIIKRDDQSQGKWRRFAVVGISPDIQFDCSPIKEIDGVINSADCIFHYGNFAYRDTEKYLEIIGNIYENPELLNQ